MSSLKQFTKEWIVPVVVAIILALLINHFLIFKIKVPTGSMLPTIQLQDNIFVTRIYNYNNIKRGDIIVFNSEELHELLIKRVIGLPGDTVEVKDDNTVWINGKKIDEPYVKFNGGKANVKFEKVPENKYLFLGDNRENSLDARYWKEQYISTKDIKGKAQIIVYPFNRIGFLK